MRQPSHAIPHFQLRKILIANDGSAGAIKALKMAGDLARQYEAELHTITIQEHLPQHRASVIGGELRPAPAAADYARLAAIQAGLIVAASGVHLTQHVVSGHEVEAIITFAKEHQFDLLVVGFTGHSKILGQEWGSTSQNLARLAPCSVLVVK